MAFRKYLIFFLPLLFLSCAQVGVLSGGVKDEIAPQVIAEKTIPQNESINFTGNSVEMTFNEFIQLNNPAQTIIMLPGNIRAKASIHKKILKIEWNDTLEKNTTYVIYLNGAIRDVSENNDSLMVYAFSTGAFLDSLRYSVRVIDAWTNKAVPNAVVGLFKDSVDVKPYYYARSNSFGNASFSNLKQGNYYIRAFVDENKDLTMQTTEALAFRSEFISLDISVVDTLPLRVSKPNEKSRIRTFKYVAPGSFLVGATYAIDKAYFYLNNEHLDSSKILFHSKDSVQLFADVKSLNEVQLVVKTASQSDTSTLRIIEKEKSLKIIAQPLFKNKQVGPHESISFSINDQITKVDQSKISVINPLDSTLMKDFSVLFSLNKVTLILNRKEYTELKIIFHKAAITTLNEKENDSSSVTLQLKSEKNYGTINLSLSGFDMPVIVELLQKNTVVSMMISIDLKKCRFDNLDPGEYTFRIIEDINKNDKWDTGNFQMNLQAEKVYLFPELIKVRANWEIDLTYTP